MDPIYTFGFKLAELMNQKGLTGIGLICLAIKDSGKEYNNLSYEDFRTVFQVHLPKRLEKMNVANRQQIAAEMLRVLSLNQSIFTLSYY